MVHMLWVSLVLLYILPSSGQFTQSCLWETDKEDFSLQGAQGYEIQCVDGNNAYGYTPCMSYALCNGQRYQSVYFSRTNGQCNYYLAEWDDGATVPIFENNDGIYTWTFKYTNGQTCNGKNREFDVVWQCDESAQPFSLQTVCGSVNGDECKHTMTIRSVYACAEGVELSNSTNNGSDGLSTGSLVLILLSLYTFTLFQAVYMCMCVCVFSRAMVAFILYCVGGYVYSGMKQDKEERDWTQIKSHTPHWDFWTYGLCAYTKSGCAVSHEWVSAKVGSKDEFGDDTGFLDDE